jgi:hypothetical protein
MLIPGQVVEVEVQKVAVFGAFCRCQDQEVLLLIPETSWVASYCSCDQFTAPGDRLLVKILHVDPSTGKASATIRGLHPDPWADGRLVPGLEYLARVVRHIAAADRCGHRPGFLLELMPGTFVVLCYGDQALQPRQQVRVVVRESDFSKRSVTVALGESPPHGGLGGRPPTAM